MSSRKKKWLLAAGLTGVGLLITIFLVGRHMARRFEPYIKQQAIDYLKKRFESEVQIESLSVDIPRLSPAKAFFSRGKGVIARVDGAGILLRYRGRHDIPPMFAMKSFRF